MTTEYKILGQAEGRLKYLCPENKTTIFSKINIINTSHPTTIDISIGNSSLFKENVDEDFIPEIFYSVYSPFITGIYKQNDESIIITGSFTQLENHSTSNIARLYSNGKVDYGFKNNIGVESVEKIIFPTPNRIVSVGGGSVKIASMDKYGNNDYLFSQINPNSPVLDIANQSDGSFIIGGLFNSGKGASFAKDGIARLTDYGSLDQSFTTSLNGSKYIYQLIVQQDDKIIISGSFTSVNGIARQDFARLNSDGSLDTAFNPQISGGSISKIELQDDGKILIGGDFTTVNGTAKKYFARLNSDGSLDSTFNLDTNQTILSQIHKIYTQKNGKIIVAASFIGDEFNRDGVFRLNADGSIDESFTIELTNNINARWIKDLVEFNSGDIIFVGNFDEIDNVTISNIAKITYSPTEQYQYIVKNKELDFNDKIEINGGVALSSGEIIFINSDRNSDLVIQAYGVES